MHKEKINLIFTCIYIYFSERLRPHSPDKSDESDNGKLQSYNCHAIYIRRSTNDTNPYPAGTKSDKSLPPV